MLQMHILLEAKKIVQVNLVQWLTSMNMYLLPLWLLTLIGLHRFILTNSKHLDAYHHLFFKWVFHLFFSVRADWTLFASFKGNFFNFSFSERVEPLFCLHLYALSKHFSCTNFACSLSYLYKNDQISFRNPNKLEPLFLIKRINKISFGLV